MVVKYHDIKFFLVAIPLINALIYYLTYPVINFDNHTYLTYTIDTVQGYIVWFVLRSIVIWLDKKMPYTANPLRRIVVQLILTTSVCIGLIIIMTILSAWIIKGNTRIIPSFYTFDLLIIFAWLLIINGVYIGIYYVQAFRHTEHLRQEEKKLRSGGFTVRSGKQNLLLAFDEINGFYVESDYAVLISREGKKYLLDQSLDKIEKSLPEEKFFRVNRQFIFNRRILTGFERAENGKLNIRLSHSEYFQGDVQISRTKAAAFKRWFSADQNI
jgi:hypothetical protein